MHTRRLILIINYFVLIVSCMYGFDSLRFGIFLSVSIALFGALLALACLSLAIVVHRSFPKKHDESSDFTGLVTTGPYSYVRHPFYSVLIGLNYAISLVFLSIYAIIASTFILPLWWYLAKTEEDDLVHVWGQKYSEYRREVSMFFPTYRRKKRENRMNTHSRN
jgi:protein-S-isoprenylcysteine O-methyltransferase Ste14